MRAVGIREFKAHMSEHLRAVRSGEILLITDRGEVIAEVRSPLLREAPSPYPALFGLAERGEVEIGAPNSDAEYPELSRVTTAHKSRDLLDQERGDQ